MLDDITRNFHGGNPQSEAANASIASLKDITRKQVEDYIRDQGLFGGISDEVEVALGLPHQTVSARLSEAKRDGTLVLSGDLRPTRSGRQAAVLVAPEYVGEREQ